MKTSISLSPALLKTKFPFTRSFIIVTMVMISLISHEATSQKKLFRLHADQSVKHATWRDSVYVLPSFEEGTLTFIDGFSPDFKFRLNYNAYLEHMYFITSEGDTVPLKKQKTLKLVKIKDREFYYDYKNGFIEIIRQGKVSLGKKEVFTFLGQVIEQRVHGTTEIRFSEGTDVRGVTERNDRLYRKDALYYLIDDENKVYPATRSSILRLSKRNRNDVVTLLNQHTSKQPYTEVELLNILNVM